MLIIGTPQVPKSEAPHFTLFLLYFIETAFSFVETTKNNVEIFHLFIELVNILIIFAV